MKAMTSPTTTTTTATWFAVVPSMCGNGHVACWFGSEQTQTGGEHLSYDRRSEGGRERGKEGRIPNRESAGEGPSVDAS